MFGFQIAWRRNLHSVLVVWELLRDGLQFMNVVARRRTAVAAEVLFLRKQLAYYQDHQIRPRRLTDAARLSLVLWSRLFDREEALGIVTAATFVRCHRKSFKLYWRWKSCGGRPPLPKEIRQLIARMVRENVTWGEERIADELSLKLGICVSPRTVRKYWPKESGDRGRTRTSSQHWTTFVKNHAQGIVACDFLVAGHGSIPGVICIRGTRGREPPHSSLQRDGSSDRRLDAAAVSRSHSWRPRLPVPDS